MAKYGIPSVLSLLEGVKIAGANANTFDGRKSNHFAKDSRGGKKSGCGYVTKTVKQYFLDNKNEVGAMVQFYGGKNGKNVMFLGHYYFNPKNDSVSTIYQKAFIIMHESVHLVGKLGDKDFGGSGNLSELLVKTFFPAGTNRLGGVA